MKLSVIIVSYNVREYLEQCLDSLMKAMRGVDGDVYIVDNHSKDGTVEYLRPRFPYVNFISSRHNLGFARANNIAIRRTESDYVLLLNPDTIVGEDTVRNSLSFMESHPDAGGLGVCMIKSDGNKAMESRRGLPTPLVALYKMCGLCARFPRSRRFGKYYMSYLPWDRPVRIEVISGAYCMLRHSALDRVGLLDEDFFMYGEDIDLSYRLLKNGYTNWFIPETILHYKGESTQKTSFRYVHVFYDAMLIFFRKHYGHLSFCISLPVKAAIYIKAMLALMRMQAERARKAVGLVSRKKRHSLTEYIFLGAAESIANCRKLANDNGLKARFVECDERTCKEGHLGFMDSISQGTVTYAVYDVDAFSYSTILGIFAGSPKDNLIIGTYNKRSNIVITDREIIK